MEVAPVTDEERKIAEHHLNAHVPLDQYAERPVCASAVHGLGATVWPCPQWIWARSIQRALAREEETNG